MSFVKTLENEWIKAGLQMVTLKQHLHSPRDMGILMGHEKKNFNQGHLLYLFYVLYVDDGALHFEHCDQIKRGLYLIFSHFTRFGLKIHIGKVDKAPKTECVFFPTTGFLNGNASCLLTMLRWMRECQ